MAHIWHLLAIVLLLAALQGCHDSACAGGRWMWRRGACRGTVGTYLLHAFRLVILMAGQVVSRLGARPGFDGSPLW
eukprot:363278-Chlamydomonas_euryale.AAC.10